MPTCKLCAKQYPEGAKFCGGCGTPTVSAAPPAEDDALAGLFEIGSSSPATPDLFSVSPPPASAEAEPSSESFDALFPEPPRAPAGAGDELTDESLEALFEGVVPEGPGANPSAPDLSDLFAESGAPLPGNVSPSTGSEADLSDLFASDSPASGGGVGGAYGGSPGSTPRGGDDLSDLFADDGAGTASPPSLENVFSEAEETSAAQGPRPGSTEAEFARLSASAVSERQTSPSGNALPVSDVDGLFSEEDDDEGEGEGEEELDASRPRRLGKSKERRKKKRIQVVVVEKESWAKKLASFGLLTGVSALAGLAAAPRIPLAVPHLWAAVAGVLLLGSLVLRKLFPRLFRIHMTTQTAFLIVTVATFLAHGMEGGSPGDALLGIAPARLLVYVMLGVMAQAIYYALFNRLLWAGFRLSLAIMGVYGSLTLFAALVTPEKGFLDLARARTLPLPTAQLGLGDAMGLLFKAFEPLFVAVNVFLPALVLVGGLEIILHLWKKRWDKGLTVLLFLALFAVTTFYQMRIYQEAGIENLKSLYGKVRQTMGTPR